METKNTGTPVNLDQLMEKMSAEDTRNRKLTRRFQILYWVLTPLYAALMVVNPDNELPVSTRITGGCFVLSFIAFALIFRYQHKEYASVDYSLSTVEMLQQAVKRYTLWRPYLLTVLIPIVLMDIGLCFSFVEDLHGIQATNIILVVQAILIPTFCISFLIGVLIWRKRQKPLRDHALKLLDEMYKD